MHHLDDALWGRIASAPDGIDRATWAHLREPGCATCAAFRAALPTDDRRLEAALHVSTGRVGLGAFQLSPGGDGARLVRTVLGLLAVVGLALAVTGFLFWRTLEGPRALDQAEPLVSIHVAPGEPGAPPMLPGATVGRGTRLVSTITLDREAYVTLVHLNGLRGMQALLLNVKLGPGEHTLEKDGKPLALALEDVDGTSTQKVAVAACARPLLIDEALSTARGLTRAGIGFAQVDFTVR